MTESSSEALAESESNSRPNNNRIPGGNRTPSVLRLSNNNTHRGAAPGAAPHGGELGIANQSRRPFRFLPSRSAIGAPRPQRRPPPRGDWLLFPALCESFEYASLVQIESKDAQRRHNGGGRDADSLLRDVSVRLSQLREEGFLEPLRDFIRLIFTASYIFSPLLVLLCQVRETAAASRKFGELLSVWMMMGLFIEAVKLNSLLVLMSPTCKCVCVCVLFVSPENVSNVTIHGELLLLHKLNRVMFKISFAQFYLVACKRFGKLKLCS